MAKRIPPSPIASVPHGTSRPRTADEEHALTHEDGDAETTGASTPAGERPTPAQPHEAQQSGDAAIRDDIHRRLAVVADLDISHIDVTVTSGLALLTGNVPERWMQHEVQAIVSKVPGVSGVDNRLHERRTQPMSRPGESQEGHKI